MGGNPRLFQPLHQKIAHFVVDHTFTDDRSLFESVESGGIVLVGYDEHFGIVRGKDLFGSLKKMKL